MRNSAIFNLNRNKFFDSFKKNKFIIFTLAAYVTGIIIGILWLKNSKAVTDIAATDFNSYVSLRIGGTFPSIFYDSFISFLPICLVFFLCGTSVVGIILIPILICYCGFDYGICTGYLYSNYLLQGIAFNSLILIPCTVIAVLGYLLLSRESFYFSLQLLRVTMPNSKNPNIYSGFKGYCKKFFFLMLIFVGASLLDALLTYSFITYFAF